MTVHEGDGSLFDVTGPDSGRDEATDIIRLNDAQQEAVDHRGGPLIVLAGPGTGKTRVIISRIERLLLEGAAPESILALTFTVKAAEEMRERLSQRVDPTEVARVRMGTFHGFGRRVLLRHGSRIGLPDEQHLMDSARHRRLMRSLIHEHDLFAEHAASGRSSLIGRAQAFISDCRNHSIDPAGAMERAVAWGDRLARNEDGLEGDAYVAAQATQREATECARLFALMERATVERGMMLFDDFLALTNRIMRESSDAAAMVRSELRHIVVDEFQDVNRAQIEMLEHLAPPRPGVDLCVVGDDDQAIYAFRGSDPLAFRHFESIWTDATTIALEMNYRSTPRILRAAAAFIERTDDRFRPEKTVLHPSPDADPGPEIEGVLCQSDTSYGPAVLRVLVEDQQRQPDRDLSRYAVIARNNGDLDRIATALEMNRIPHHFKRAPSLLQDEAVRDIVAWLRLVADPTQAWDAVRILVRPPYGLPLEDVSHLQARWDKTVFQARKTGETAPDFVAWLAEHGGGDEALRRFVTHVERLRAYNAEHTAAETAYETVRRSGLTTLEPTDPEARSRRIRNLASLMQFIVQCQRHLDPPGDLASFWRYYEDLSASEQDFAFEIDARVDIDEEPDAEAEASGGVTLLTAHRAKGLEFDTVILARVTSPHGYPKRSRPQDEGIPPEMLDEASGDRESEERRLFYVAMTRAERRLVLLTAKKGKAYFDELAKNAALEIVTRNEEEIGPEADERPGPRDPLSVAAEAIVGAPAAGAGRRLLDREHQSVCERLYGLLHRTSFGLDGERELGEVQAEVAECVGRLTVLGRAEALGRAEGDVDREAFAASLPPELQGFARRMLEASRPADPRSLVHPFEAPLKLSYSTISAYLKCPACFYVNNGLNLRGPVTRPLFFGNAAHKALETFYDRRRHAIAEGRGEPTREDLLKFGMQFYLRMIPPYMTPRDEELDKLKEQLCNAFDRLHDPDAEVLELEKNFALPLEVDGIEHILKGKIDRLDQLADGSFRIVDYKTGYAKKDILEPKATDLQMGIYALALRHEFGLEDFGSGGAEYWVLSSGERGRIAFADIDFDKVQGAIETAVRGIMSSEFGRGKDCAKKAPQDCAILGTWY